MRELSLNDLEFVHGGLSERATNIFVGIAIGAVLATPTSLLLIGFELYSGAGIFSAISKAAITGALTISSGALLGNQMSNL